MNKRTSSGKGIAGNVELSFFIAGVEESVAWETGRELTGLNFKKKGSSWLLVVTTKRKGNVEVAFVDSPTPLGCYQIFYQLLRGQGLKWRKSKY